MADDPSPQPFQSLAGDLYQKSIQSTDSNPLEGTTGLVVGIDRRTNQGTL